MSIPVILFNVTMGLVALGWIPLCIAPAKRAINWWLSGVVIPFVVTILFTYLLLAYWDQPADQSFFATLASRFFSLGGVGSMLQNEGLLAATWLDNLAMGMVGGAWITRRAQRTGLPYPALLVCQLVTLAMSPLGVVLYFVIEAARGRLRETGGSNP
jgi:hypothetical protein